jgi:hypothetical protein
VFDQILAVSVVILPTLFAVFIEVTSKKIKERQYWKNAVRAFGVGLSAVTWFQMSRAGRTANIDRQNAIVETSERVSAKVSESVSKSVTHAVSEQYTQTINSLQTQIGTLQSQLTTQGKKVDVIQESDIVTGKKPVKVEITNGSPPGNPTGQPAVRVSRVFVTPRPEYGKLAIEFILTTDRVMNGGKASFHCKNKINNGTAQIAGASTQMGAGGLDDQNTFKAWIETPNWTPAYPLVVTLYADEDIGKCVIKLLE